MRRNLNKRRLRAVSCSRSASSICLARSVAQRHAAAESGVCSGTVRVPCVCHHELRRASLLGRPSSVKSSGQHQHHSSRMRCSHCCLVLMLSAVQVVDRPKLQGTAVENREYVQPQWIYDCINNNTLLPTFEYQIGHELPAHLSPFVDNDAEG